MIYIKTELGKTALQDRSLGLSPRQSSAFIMCDGTRTLDDVFKLTSALGVTADDIDRLVTLGLLAPAAGVARISPAPPVSEQGPTAKDQAHYAKAYLIAVRLTGSLGLRGFRLNLAVESAGDLEELKDLAPKIKEAVGLERFRELEDALYR